MIPYVARLIRVHTDNNHEKIVHATNRRKIRIVLRRREIENVSSLSSILRIKASSKKRKMSPLAANYPHRLKGTIVCKTRNNTSSLSAK